MVKFELGLIVPLQSEPNGEIKSADSVFEHAKLHDGILLSTTKRPLNCLGRRLKRTT